MSLDWVARQIQAARELGTSEQPQLVWFNPRPPGAPINGSATTAVLELMRAYPMRWFVHKDLVSMVNRDRPDGQAHSRSAVDWALIRLRSWGMVETCEDSRSPRYLRYRITPEGGKR